MTNHNVHQRRRCVCLFFLGVCICAAFGLLACAPGVSAASAHPAKLDPKCAGHGCDGTDPYATLCAGQPFDHEVIVRSAPITSQGRLFGMVQLWYSPLCQTTWARTVPLPSALLLQATLRLPGERFTATAQDAREVISPQAFAPTLFAAAFGKVLRNGRLAAGCASLASPVFCDV